MTFKGKSCVEFNIAEEKEKHDKHCPKNNCLCRALVSVVVAAAGSPLGSRIVVNAGPPVSVSFVLIV
eukprot:CAMPEP_0173418460 /NCGR_PEP_ID=MMETSP1357-20121228/607_1 /TAXON_ID=77926 /ORGANISM="Hemiselmis rufescens, Strain PCC563" /LENGTH=66 /DNA_ID=CAMNT_0014380953 /DNA_START=577 /DNA_END=773 /DNA_ORIENTATION=+